MNEQTRHFQTRFRSGPGGRAFIDLPFDPTEAWGVKDVHHMHGTVNGLQVRGPLSSKEGAYFLALGPAWVRDCGLDADADLDVVLWPEGPQTEALAPDLVAALDAEPEARPFFDSLATFYRKAYLTWVDATKRRPEERARRVALLIEHLKAGKKER